MGMNPTGGGDQIVEAEVPMAEMMTYAIDLRLLVLGLEDNVNVAELAAAAGLLLVAALLAHLLTPWCS